MKNVISLINKCTCALSHKDLRQIVNNFTMLFYRFSYLRIDLSTDYDNLRKSEQFFERVFQCQNSTKFVSGSARMVSHP